LHAFSVVIDRLKAIIGRRLLLGSDGAEALIGRSKTMPEASN
jgi:hypothetical protein